MSQTEILIVIVAAVQFAIGTYCGWMARRDEYAKGHVDGSDFGFVVGWRDCREYYREHIRAGADRFGVSILDRKPLGLDTSNHAIEQMAKEERADSVFLDNHASFTSGYL